MWSKILKAGENTGENGMQRMKENMISAEKCDRPSLYALRKDHKSCTNSIAGPYTRPVCGATAAHNGKLSHLLSMLLKEAKKLDEDSCESTEDLLAEIHEVNEATRSDLQADEKLMVGSLDVKALYPSIDVDFAAEIVAKEIYRSQIQIDEDSVDAEELGLYLILTVDEEELLQNGIREYCPSRIHSRGRKPNVSGQAGSSKETRKTVWNPAKERHPDKNKLRGHSNIS